MAAPVIPPYEVIVGPDWIDYNGHMRDACYGMAFSLAIDAFQEAIGFDRAYRQETDCTVYLLEDHKKYVREVTQGEKLSLITDVLDLDEKRFLLRLTMFSGGNLVSAGEFLEMHVSQRPTPRAAPMPEALRARLTVLKVIQPNGSEDARISRRLSLTR